MVSLLNFISGRDVDGCTCVCWFSRGLASQIPFMMLCVRCVSLWLHHTNSSYLPPLLHSRSHLVSSFSPSLLILSHSLSSPLCPSPYTLPPFHSSTLPLFLLRLFSPSPLTLLPSLSSHSFSLSFRSLSCSLPLIYPSPTGPTSLRTSTPLSLSLCLHLPLASLSLRITVLLFLWLSLLPHSILPSTPLSPSLLYLPTHNYSSADDLNRAPKMRLQQNLSAKSYEHRQVSGPPTHLN